MDCWPEIKRLALARGVKPTAAQKWRERKTIPWRWRTLLASDATEAGRPDVALAVAAPDLFTEEK